MKVYLEVLAEGSCREDGRPCIWFPNQCSCFEQKTSGFFFVACAMAGALEYQREEWYRNGRCYGERTLQAVVAQAMKDHVR